MTDRKRFMSFVKVSESGCWLWTGCTLDGYGRFQMPGKNWLAHRWAWKFIAGRDLPEELHHRCRVRRCVNPDHVSPTTKHEHPDNPTVINRLKTHCEHGHSFIEANTYIDSLGKRHCRKCRNDVQRDPAVVKAQQAKYYAANRLRIRAQQADYHRKQKRA